MSFPPELHLFFIDSLWDSLSDLKNCALVSRFWLQRVNVLIFSCVAISDHPLSVRRKFVNRDLITRQTRIGLENWDLVKESKHLTDVICSLSFGFEATEGPTDGFLEPVPHALPRLSVLEIRNCHPRSAVQLSVFLYSLFPSDPDRSQKRTLTSIGILLRHPPELNPVWDADATTSHSTHRIQIRRLLYGVNSPDIDEALFTDSTSVFDLDGLEWLQVQTFSYDCIPILQRFGATVRHLELLLFPDGILLPYGIYPSAEDLSVVSLVPNLISLTLDCQYHVDSYQTLSRQIIQITATRPCNKLERVTIILGSGDAQAIIGSSLDKELIQLAHTIPSISAIEIELSTRLGSSHHEQVSQLLLQSLRQALPETDKAKILRIGWKI